MNIRLSILSFATCFVAMNLDAASVVRFKKNIEDVLYAEKPHVGRLKTLLRNQKMHTWLNKFKPALPLVIASDFVWIDGMCELAHAGARFDLIEEQTGKSALHMLADREKFEKVSETDRAKLKDVIREHINKGICAIDVLDHKKWTPLMFAAEGGCTQSAAMLLDLGANPNLVNDSQETALHIAVWQKNHNIVALLVLHPDIDFEVCDEYGRTARDIAYEEDNKSAIEMIEKVCSHDESSSESLLSDVSDDESDSEEEACPATISSEQSGSSESISERDNEDIQERRYNPCAVAEGLPYWTPLFYAVAAHNRHEVLRLLKAGADPEECDATGDTPLMMLEKMPKTQEGELIKFLLRSTKRTALVSDAKKQAERDFLSAARDCNLSALRVAFERGESVNTIFDDGTRWAPLFYAVVAGDIEAVAFLLGMHANPNIRDASGETPLAMLRNMETSELDEVNHRRAQIETMLLAVGAK